MKSNITETIAIGMMPVVFDISNVSPWITSIAGSVTIIWVLYQLIKSIRNDLKDRKEKRRNKEE